MVIYVGDSRNIIGRIQSNHCRGNVEGSALRKMIAISKGYKLLSMKRTSGSTKVRIDLPNPKMGEADVSRYIRSGIWRYVICATYDEAHDFQWFAIDQLRPILNVSRKDWNKQNAGRYEELLETLKNSNPLTCHDLKHKCSGPGVYVLYHQELLTKRCLTSQSS